MIARTKPREWLFYQLLGKLTLSDSQIFYRVKKRLLSRYDLKAGEFDFSDDNIKDAFVLNDTKTEPSAPA